MSKLQNKKCITPECRLAFMHLFKPHTGFEGQEPKFSTVALFEKTVDLTPIKMIVNNAIIEKWGSEKGKWPKNLRLPFRNGDEKTNLEGYAGTIYITATSKQRPGVVNCDLSNIVEDDGAIYPGCYARLEIMAFAYDTAGNKGVSLSLQNVQKLRDGESFSGRKKASDVFSKVEDGSNNPSNYDAVAGF